MGDADQGGAKRRNGLSIFLGIVGAVVGYAGLIALAALLGFGNPHDPITTGLTALFLVGPIGAVAGIFLGAKLGAVIAGRRAGDAALADEGAAAPSVARNGLKALAIVVATVAVGIGGYLFYAYQTATPWMRPANVRIEFEVRLPSGAPMPTGEVKAELQTSVNTMPADMKPERYRQEGDQAVIAGEVWLAYRTNQRQIEVKIPGRMDRIYQLKLKSSPPHTPHLGAWERHPDGSEIRYRVRYPGGSVSRLSIS